MEQRTINQLRWLTAYAVLSGIIICGLLIDRLYSASQPNRFDEISVERINVVEADGQLKLVISNQARQHPGLLNGKPIPARSRPAGMLFFNSAGDECGGLVYDSNKEESSLSFSVDQFRNDQIMQLQYGERSTSPQHTRHYGLRLWDQADAFPLAQRVALIDSLKRNADPKALQQAIARLKAQHLLSEERLFVGRETSGDVGLFIRDKAGRPRIRLFVNQEGNAQFEALDTMGRPTSLIQPAR